MIDEISKRNNMIGYDKIACVGTSSTSSNCAPGPPPPHHSHLEAYSRPQVSPYPAQDRLLYLHRGKSLRDSTAGNMGSPYRLHHSSWLNDSDEFHLENQV